MSKEIIHEGTFENPDIKSVWHQTHYEVLRNNEGRIIAHFQVKPYELSDGTIVYK